MVWLVRHIKYNICIVIFEKSACMVFPIKLRCVIVSIICFLVFFLSQFLWREINHSIVPFLQRTSTYTKKGVVKINMRPVLGMISNCYGKQLRRECGPFWFIPKQCDIRANVAFGSCMEWKLQQISLSVNCSISVTWFECLIWTKDTRVKEINFL